MPDPQPTNSINKSSNLASRIIPLVRAYQSRGHIYADVDPLGIPKQPPWISNQRARLLQRFPKSSLDYHSFGLRDTDLDRKADVIMPHTTGFLGTWGLTNDERMAQWQGSFVATLPPDKAEPIKVAEMLDRLNQTYCGTIGVEYLHIQDPEKCNFIRRFIELPSKYAYSDEMKLKILKRTAKARLFESFIASKFATVKRFGLDGCESMVVGMKALTKLATLMGVESVVIGMPHRGRLNVLTNVLQKPFHQVMSEFQGVTGFGGHEWGNIGDVKYHLGVEFEYVDRDNGKRVMMSVLPNPSHLEAVGPVVAGNARAKQYFFGGSVDKVLPIALHGDAAYSGQGVVYETMQMSDIPGNTVGGTIHIVVNNQIGFTTNVVDAGSGIYATDLAKAVSAPVFHVNADDPEAVTYAAELALKYRQKFHSDVIIDIVGYRRYGHNELDMPKFTQPHMYDLINDHPHVLDIYGKKLVDENIITSGKLETLKNTILQFYQDEFDKSKSFKPTKSLRPFSPQWSSISTPDQICAPRITGVPEELLKDLGRAITLLPSDLSPHPTIAKVYKTRADAIAAPNGSGLIDFGFAESLAFASLLQDGFKIRMSGQDAERGTFSHRHAIVHDQKTLGRTYFPLRELVESRKYKHDVEIWNSSLSEYASLGFEYGYSLEDPNILSIWEAQFGDFVNGAQIVIDQFIASGEVKWKSQSALVLLLPHGYDGQGSEHSSGRMERFLQLCDDREDIISPIFWDVATRSVIQKHNLQVVNCTTPANFFHVLRRQMIRGFRKPLIVFSPKKMLRMREALSPMCDLFEGTRFTRYIFDPTFESPQRTEGEFGKGSSTKGIGASPRSGVQRLVVCSGQVYYDLIAKRKALGLEQKIAIARVEQLSPFPLDQFVNDVQGFPNLTEVYWCQEEPMNQGAWAYVSSRINCCLDHLRHPNGIRAVLYAGRDVSASPAVGCPSMHFAEQDRLLHDALDLSRSANSYREKYFKKRDSKKDSSVV